MSQADPDRVGELATRLSDASARPGPRTTEGAGAPDPNATVPEEEP